MLSPVDVIPEGVYHFHHRINAVNGAVMACEDLGVRVPETEFFCEVLRRSQRVKDYYYYPVVCDMYEE
jgi:hypothetical protein